MNENFRIIESTDELIICDEDGYPYIRVNYPDNNNPKVEEIVEEILMKIDLSEMIQ